MRIVADTNVIVSAFLWGGVPRQLLDAAEAQRLELFTSRASSPQRLVDCAALHPPYDMPLNR